MIECKICEQCGLEYRNVYKSDGYDYTLPTRFCSKRCATLYQMSNNTNENYKVKPAPPRDELIKEIEDFILDSDRYCTTVEVVNGVNRSNKTFTKNRISIKEINHNLGYFNTRSKFEDEVSELLTEKFDCEIKREQTFDGLVGNTGYPLKVDFYIPSENVVIEADGTQHKNKDHIWNTKAPNGSTFEYDQIKNDYFKEKGIRIVRIPYNRKVTTEHIEKHFNES